MKKDDSHDYTTLGDHIELGRATPWCNASDFNNFVCMLSIIVYSFIKLGVLNAGYLFMTLEGNRVSHTPYFTFDSFDLLTHSPRFLALWTMCYMARTKFTGKKDTLSAVQYTILR